MKKNFFTAKRPHVLALNVVKALNFCQICGFFAVKNIFHRIHRISYKKETPVHGFEPLTSCMSTSAYSTSQSVTYLIDISCAFMISVEISGKISDFSEKYFSPHLPGSGNFFHRILLVAVKNFFTAFCW